MTHADTHTHNAERRIVVTGAAGFIGRRVVAARLDNGDEVAAIVRPGGAADMDAGARRIEADLSEPSLSDAALDAIGSADTVIHLAGRMTGDDRDHEKDTVAPTRRVMEAIAASRGGSGAASPGAPPDLVLVSSLSVYGYASLPDDGPLDELTPLEPDPQFRDAYARAKLAQEALARRAAQEMGLRVRVVRPGAVVSDSRLWTARLGVRAAGRLFRIGDPIAPIIHVDECAAAICAAAQTPIDRNDILCEPAETGRTGAFDVVNLIGDSPPRVSTHIEKLAETDEAPTSVVKIPWRIAKVAGQAGALIALIAPGIAARLPSLARAEALHARFKPLQYHNHRMRSRLIGHSPPEDAKSAQETMSVS